MCVCLGNVQKYIKILDVLRKLLGARRGEEANTNHTGEPNKEDVRRIQKSVSKRAQYHLARETHANMLGESHTIYWRV